MNKKITGLIIIIIIIIVIAITIVAFVFNSSEHVAGTIKIGLSESLSGNAAYYGQNTKKGADLGFGWLKEKYPNIKFEAIHEDNQFDSKHAIDNYNKLKSVDNVDAVIIQTTPAALAIEPLAIKDGMLMMAVSVSADKYTTPNDLTFRTTAASSQESIPMVKYIGENFKKIAFLYMNNDIGLNEVESTKKGLSTNPSVEVVFTEAYSLTTTDYRSYLMKIKQLQPDAVYIAGLAAHVSNVLKQMRDLGMTAKVLTFRTGEDQLLIKNSGQLAEGVVFTSAFDPDSSNQEMQNFVTSFKAKYNGDTPDTYSAEGYEGVRLVGTAFAKCGKDYECIKNYLNDLSDYQSVFGQVKIDGNGDISYPYFLKTVKDGKFVKINN